MLTWTISDCSAQNMSFRPKAGTAGELVSQEFPIGEDGTILSGRGHTHGMFDNL
jgi:hypothetical protein